MIYADRQKLASGAAEDTQQLDILENLLQAVPTGIGLVHNRVIVQANQHLCEITGYASDELIDREVRMLYPTRDVFERADREQYAQISRVGTGTVETCWQRKDGCLINVRLSATPLEAEGMDGGLAITAHDITKRKKAEETIAAQKSHLAILHEITLGLIHRRDLDDLLQALVVGAAELAGTQSGFAYVYDDDTGELVIRAAHGHYERDLAGLRLRPGQGLAGKVWQTGETMLIEDYRRWEGRIPDPFLDELGAVICLPIKLRQRVLGVIGLGHFGTAKQFGRIQREALERLADLAALGMDNARLYDSLQTELAEKKAAEAVLRHYEQMVTASTDYMALLDREYVYREINAAYQNALGRSRAEIVGLTAEALFGRNTFEKHHKPRLERCLAGEEVHGKHWYNTPAIGRRYVDTHFYPIREENGEISGAVVVGRDLTNIKKLEDQLLQSQKMEAVGTLAGGIAHDFNNILMGIQGRASLMADEIDAAHPAGEHIEAVETYVRSAADLTGQLLGFAQGGKYEISPTDLNALIKKHNHMFSRTRKELTIVDSYAPDLHTVEVDRGQIRQVLLNIYLNAWQAMPEGGTIYVETANVSIVASDQTLAELKPGDYVKLTITDTGEGMDEGVCQRVFDPFFTTRTIGRGTGLGLASAYGIVKNHGGIINVDSEKGHGAAFSVYLPASAQTVNQVPRSDARMQSGSGTIMLVDDERMIIEVGTAMLQKLGYEVLTAEDGEGALRLYQRQKARINLIILDMVMPGMGGGEVFDRLKALDPDVKVLLSSGYSLDGQARQIIKRGCVGFIQKPFSLAQLSEKLKSASG